MFDLVDMIIINKTKDIARSMLADRVTIEFVMRHTGLDEETVRKLKDEMEAIVV